MFLPLFSFSISSFHVLESQNTKGSQNEVSHVSTSMYALIVQVFQYCQNINIML